LLDRSSRACAGVAAVFIIEVMAARSAATLPLVLIVEDDPETRHFYAHALASAGFRTAQAHNGYQALDKVFDARPDLIIADIAIPGMDGIELCRRLRSDARARAVPVLAITGYGDRHYEDRARAAGADQVLIKPCAVDLLVEEARRLVGVRVAVDKLAG
jgi:two-component system cell cycle response regulator DivK